LLSCRQMHFRLGITVKSSPRAPGCDATIISE
jgi:hypothetical protein